MIIYGPRETEWMGSSIHIGSVVDSKKHTSLAETEEKDIC